MIFSSRIILKNNKDWATFYYSVWVGLYSLVLSFSSYMVWVYWVEARPYPLWILLTVAQSLLFLSMMREEKIIPSDLKWLVGIHWLLSLTTAFSLIQITIVSFLLWILKERKWKIYIFLAVIPACFCFFYLFNSPKYDFWFGGLSPWGMVTANIPVDRMIVFGFYLIFLLFYFWNKRKRFVKLDRDVSFLEGGSYLAMIIFMMMAVGSILAILKIMNIPPGPGFQVSNRYFIFLTPVSIIATSLFSVHLIRAFKNQAWMLVNTVIILGGLLVIRCLRTYLDVVTLKLY